MTEPTYLEMIRSGEVPLKEHPRMEREARFLVKFAAKNLGVRAVFAGKWFIHRPLVTFLDAEGNDLGIFFGDRGPVKYVNPTWWDDQYGSLWRPNHNVKITTRDDLDVWLHLKPSRWPIA